MNISKKIFFTFITLVLYFICCELLLSFTDLDVRLIRKILYYQEADLAAHRISQSAERLYELLPGASIQDANDFINPVEKKYTKRSVTINSLGLRDKERTKEKDDNVFRIIVLGGSNTYGLSVSDEDTYPAQMQRIFDERFPGKVEVWNAGICAYVMSQETAYAEYLLSEYAPDLLIFENWNDGRRAFLFNTDFPSLKKTFKTNRILFTENIPLLFSNSLINDPDYCDILLSAHIALVSYLKLYRIYAISINALLRRWNFNNHLWGCYGDFLSRAWFREFISQNSGIKMVYFDPLDQLIFTPQELKAYQQVTYYSLNKQDKPEEYYNVHPPSYVYEWYAQELCSFLIQNGYIKNIDIHNYDNVPRSTDKIA